MLSVGYKDGGKIACSWIFQIFHEHQQQCVSCFVNIFFYQYVVQILQDNWGPTSMVFIIFVTFTRFLLPFLPYTLVIFVAPHKFLFIQQMYHRADVTLGGIFCKITHFLIIILYYTWNNNLTVDGLLRACQTLNKPN